MHKSIKNETEKRFLNIKSIVNIISLGTGCFSSVVSVAYCIETKEHYNRQKKIEMDDGSHKIGFAPVKSILYSNVFNCLLHKQKKNLEIERKLKSCVYFKVCFCLSNPKSIILLPQIGFSNTRKWNRLQFSIANCRLTYTSFLLR